MEENLMNKVPSVLTKRQAKKYAVIGKVTLDDYSYKFDEKFYYLGAEKRNRFSSLVDYVFVADRPGIKTLLKIEDLQKKGKDIKLIPYFKAVEIANETNKYMVYYKDIESQAFIQKINDIIINIKNTCDTSNSGLFLNDRYYEERLRREVEKIEYEKEEKKKLAISVIVFVIVLIIAYVLNLWLILGIIGLVSLFPNIMGKVIGSFVKSLFK